MRHGHAGRLVITLAAVLAVMGMSMSTASAAGIETLLMPGKVSAAHAKIEQECSKCHDRADRAAQSGLCMACHKEVGADVRSHSGFHGRLPGIEQGQCSACHAEHLGRAADIVKFTKSAFDHSRTDYPLEGAHSSAACAGCHKAGQKFRLAPHACIDCHRSDDAHGGKFGTACADCHKVNAWAGVRFDHSKTGFALRDRHQQVTCDACHFGKRFKDTPTKCVACHAPDDVHAGSRGPDCASCHTTAGWKTSEFDHAKTGFALTGSHADVDCKGCHKTANIKDPLPRNCVGCHRAEDAHAGRLGERCDTCHGTRNWKPSNFDHTRDGKFELVGAHKRIACDTCHTAVVTEQKLGSDCIACHRTTDVHSGKLGTDCASCHGTETWRKDVLFDHDLTNFPLVGLHVAVPCHQCHTAPSFKGVATGCNDCHARDDRHKGKLGKDCESCHSPDGWGIWEFDHAKTGFALVGAHARATCEGCHKQPPEEVKLASDCASCHAKDDVHLGQFGRQCQRCHGSTTFKGARVQ